LQRILVRHPAAAQGGFRALVTEGRRFAETEEGADLARRLADSELVRRGRVVWDVTTMSALTANKADVLPTVLMESFLQAIATEPLEPMLSRLMEESVGARGT
jgi:hypothetical protein